MLISLLKVKSINSISLPLAAGTFTKDPARTPTSNNLRDPVTAVDGSTGKYRHKHKHPNGKSWARRKKHADAVKPKKNREKPKEKNMETAKGS